MVDAERQDLYSGFVLEVKLVASISLLQACYGKMGSVDAGSVLKPGCRHTAMMVKE